jgi:hypothetical protein
MRIRIRNTVLNTVLVHSVITQRYSNSGLFLFYNVEEKTLGACQCSRHLQFFFQLLHNLFFVIIAISLHKIALTSLNWKFWCDFQFLIQQEFCVQGKKYLETSIADPGCFILDTGSDHFLIPFPGSGSKHFCIPDPTWKVECKFPFFLLLVFCFLCFQEQRLTGSQKDMGSGINLPWIQIPDPGGK